MNTRYFPPAEVLAAVHLVISQLVENEQVNKQEISDAVTNLISHCLNAEQIEQHLQWMSGIEITTLPIQHTKQ